MLRTRHRHHESLPRLWQSASRVRQFETRQTYLYCASGYRSLVAASILKSKGFDKVVNIVGGFKAIQTLDMPLSKFEEQMVDL